MFLFRPTFSPFLWPGFVKAIKARQKKNLGYPGTTPKEEFYKSIGVPEVGFDRKGRFKN